MSQALAVPLKDAAAARPWLLGAAFLFVLAAFYLAEPLAFTFSTSDLANLAENDLTTMDRVEGNIQSVEEGNVGRQVALLALGALGAVLLLARSPNRLRVRGPLGAAVLLFLAWCAATVLWSDLPYLTMRKAAVLGCLSLGAAGLAKHLSLQELLLLALVCTGTLLLAGVAAEIVLGTCRPWKAAYRFSGLTWPAFSAWDASLFILAALALRRGAGRWRTVLAAAAVAAFGLLLLTKTRAGLGGLGAAVVLYLAFTWPARKKWIAVLGLCLAASFGVLAVETAGGREVDGLIDVVNLGRTESASDISGRAGLWQDVVPFILEKPLGGYGYDSFWTPRRLLDVGQDNWGAPDAHNGFLNLALGVGAVGTGLYVAVLLLGLWRARAEHKAMSDVAYIFIFCALVVLIVNALFVSTQLAPALYSFVTMAVLARLGFVAPPPGEGASQPPPVNREALLGAWGRNGS